jgi:hypothetical protein
MQGPKDYVHDPCTEAIIDFKVTLPEGFSVDEALKETLTKQGKLRCFFRPIIQAICKSCRTLLQ